MGSAENWGGQHPAPEGRKIGTPPPLWMFLTPSLKLKIRIPDEFCLFATLGDLLLFNFLQLL